MDADTVTLVRTSWKRIAPIAPAAAALFYANLFTADPVLASLFKGDLAQQGERLMQMIGAAVELLDDTPSLLPVLHALARRHAGYGVRDGHYVLVGQALLKTLGQGLAADFTPPVRTAWQRVYAFIAGEMMAAARVVQDQRPAGGTHEPSAAHLGSRH